IPRRDERHHAQRLTQRVAKNIFALGGNLVAERPRAFAAKVAEDVDGAFDLAFGLGERLSFFARHLLAQVREPALENFRRPEEEFPPARRGQRRPRGPRLGGRLTRGLNVFRARHLKMTYDFAGVRGIDVRKSLFRPGGDPLATDVILEDLGHTLPTDLAGAYRTCWSQKAAIMRTCCGSCQAML